MATDLLLVFLAAAFANNFVLVKFLGLCPVMGVSRQLEAAWGMSWATALVLTLAAGLSYLVDRWVLLPLDAAYLRTLAFIVLIAGLVQGVELLLRASAPVLHQRLGIYLPLITTNCAVLGVALLNSRAPTTLVGALVFGFGAAAGFGLVLVMFAALRGRLEAADVPAPFRGAPIALVTAGLMALGFVGFSGMAVR